jgi:hypothetical protein
MQSIIVLFIPGYRGNSMGGRKGEKERQKRERGKGTNEQE